jgi:uncharacterized protein (TIGR00369 family)
MLAQRSHGQPARASHCSSPRTFTVQSRWVNLVWSGSKVSDDSLQGFVFEPDPDNPGWHVWGMTDPTRFNTRVMGKMIVRQEGERGVRLRMLPEHIHSNLRDGVHGGVTMALVDVSLFAAARIVCGANAAGAVTLDLTSQFIGEGRIGVPLDAVCEVLRETGRLVFVRGLVVQDETLVASFSGTVRKPTKR